MFFLHYVLLAYSSQEGWYKWDRRDTHGEMTNEYKSLIRKPDKPREKEKFEQHKVQ